MSERERERERREKARALTCVPQMPQYSHVKRGHSKCLSRWFERLLDRAKRRPPETEHKLGKRRGWEELKGVLSEQVSPLHFHQAFSGD